MLEDMISSVDFRRSGRHGLLDMKEKLMLLIGVRTAMTSLFFGVISSKH